MNANGTPRDFTGTTTANRTALNSWLLSANATNMSYILSAQLAAMKLNVVNIKVNGSSLIRAVGCGNTGLNNDYITVNDLIAAANTALAANPVCLSGNRLARMRNA